MKQNVKIALAVTQFVIIFLAICMIFSPMLSDGVTSFKGTELITSANVTIGFQARKVMEGSFLNTLPFISLGLFIALLIVESAVTGSTNPTHMLISKCSKVLELIFLASSIVLISLSKNFITVTNTRVVKVDNLGLTGGAITCIVFISISMILGILRLVLRTIAENEKPKYDQHAANKLSGRTVAELKAELEAELGIVNEANADTDTKNKDSSSLELNDVPEASEPTYVEEIQEEKESE